MFGHLLPVLIHALYLQYKTFLYSKIVGMFSAGYYVKLLEIIDISNI